MKKPVYENEELEKTFEALRRAVEAFENMEDDGSGLYEAASAFVEAAMRKTPC